MEAIERLIQRTPFILFFYLAVVLTRISLFFPQTIGTFHKVAGWPLAYYKSEYAITAEILEESRIVHKFIVKSNEIIRKNLVLNVVIWTVLLQSSWWMYEGKNKQKAKDVIED